MRRVVWIALAFALAASVAGCLISGALGGRGKVFGAALMPEVALRDALQLEANGLSNFAVVAEQGWGTGRRLVVYRYTDTQQRFGLAVVEMRLGWSTRFATEQSLTAPPAMASYVSEHLEGETVVYGLVSEANVHRIQALFSTGLQQEVEVTAGSGFILTAPAQAELQELRLYSADGKLLQSLQGPSPRNRNRP